jgi:hypothetical protein
MSLLSGITSMVTPVLVDRIASALGVNSALARTAINMALPAVLSAFSSRAATPAGANALFDAVKSAGVIGNLENALSGAGKDQFIKGGTTALGNVLGSSGLSELTSALSAKSGLGGAAAAMLGPIAGQVALNGLARNTSGLDAAGLARMLAAEQNTFKVSDTTTTTRTTSTVSPARPAGDGLGFLRWLIPAALAVLAGWWFLGRQPAPTVVTEPVKRATTTAPANIVIDGVDVNKSLSDTFSGLTTAYTSVTNVDTAKAALPKFGELAKSVDAVSGIAAKLTAEQKGLVGTLITAGLPAVKAAADKALAIPGVGEVLKPVSDGLLSKIDALAK